MHWTLSGDFVLTSGLVFLKISSWSVIIPNSSHSSDFENGFKCTEILAVRTKIWPPWGVQPSGAAPPHARWKALKLPTNQLDSFVWSTPRNFTLQCDPPPPLQDRIPRCCRPLGMPLLAEAYPSRLDTSGWPTPWVGLPRCGQLP
jgi:hypothetical protein